METADTQGGADDAIVTAQIGRRARAMVGVASRCHLGLPVVAEVAPVLETGEPFPTRYWLSCPLANRRIARLEAAGWVSRLEAERRDNPEFAAELDEAHASYAAGRDAILDAFEAKRNGALRFRPSGGVAGAREGVKCLHAHYAHFRATQQNPVGAKVEAHVSPLNCERACVRATAVGDFERDPAWREPEPSEVAST